MRIKVFNNKKVPDQIAHLSILKFKTNCVNFLFVCRYDPDPLSNGLFLQVNCHGIKGQKSRFVTKQNK